MRAFLRHQQRELAAGDWLAAVVGLLIRSLSLAKAPADEVDHRALVEHALFTCAALLVLVGSLSRHPTYARVRNLVALVFRINALLYADYTYTAPLLRSQQGHSGGGGTAGGGGSGAAGGPFGVWLGSWDAAGGCLIFFLKLLLASRALPLALTSFMLALPLWWVAAVQPACVALIAWRNGALCATAPLTNEQAQGWMRGAAGLLSTVAAVGAPGVQPAQERVCGALVLWLQVTLGAVLPVAFLVKGEAQRFVDFAQEQNIRCTAAYARVYQQLHEWASSADACPARWAALLGMLAAAWIVISLCLSF